ncbi:MAG TPA: thiamine diphosphokinase [Aggregatilineales bacterium]|nr:thiamine diphosphokinase [Aggregatilineales bacterium]
MQHAIVLANGEIQDADELRERLAGVSSGALVLAANGGSRHVQALGLTPDLVIGDLDSISPALREQFEAQGVAVRQAPARKDETDLELALLHAAAQGAEQIVVVGALGGRLDMTLANILLMTHPALGDTHIELWTGSQTAWLIRPPGADVHGQPGDTLSLVPLAGDAIGVTTHGLEYPLADDVLVFGPARGVSNVITEPGARVELREGLLLAIHTTGRA